MYILYTAVGNLGAVPAAQGTMLIDLSQDDAEYIAVDEQMQSSIREHKDNCGGLFSRYNVVKVCNWSLDVLVYIFISLKLQVLLANEPKNPLSICLSHTGMYDVCLVKQSYVI